MESGQSTETQLWLSKTVQVVEAINSELAGRANRERLFQLSIELKQRIDAPDEVKPIGLQRKLEDSTADSERGVSFRKGYVHGYSHALDDIDAGRSGRELNDFVNDTLYEWRDRDCSVREVPPTLPK